MFDSNEVQTYPLNADKLNKGDTIDQQTIADFLNLPINSKQYELGVLGLREKIKRALRRTEKAYVVVVTKRDDPIGPGAIRVLTDEEAVRHTGRGFKQGLRRSFRKHAEAREIDPSNLDAETRKQWERSIVVQGSILASVQSVRAKAVLKTAQRVAPPMIGYKSE